MASIKDDRDDSEGDEMDHDSNESVKSSSISDSSDASDSDDSSAEMDEVECERRRNECLETLADLEQQFITLREQLYRERIAQIKSKLEELHEGTAKEYIEPLQELQDNMRIRIEVAGVLRKLRIDNVENGFKAEEQAARQNFENEKSLLYDAMKEEIEEKMRRLEDDRNNVDLQQDIYSVDKGSRTGKNGRVTKRGAKDSDSGRRKPVTVTGPYIVYMLSEADILEDWTIIKKALSSTKRCANDRKY